MKKLILFIFLILIGVTAFINQPKKISAAKEPVRSNCLLIKGTFRATNWSGGDVMVGCAGDTGLPPNNPRSCSGEVKTVRPGQSYRLTKCSCFGGYGGCLTIAKKLHLTAKPVNKRWQIVVDKKLSDVAGFNKCTLNWNKVCGTNGQKISQNFKISCRVPKPSATPTPTPRPTITPGPSECPVPPAVVNVKVVCPNCQATPTPTPATDNRGVNQ